ncbi:DUF1501 domain-containing protein [Hydrogenimonas urashimensis]|uniref:DUF1501 domain-containing protein n=1 Tax=Hydrogenimonas urashimensis TaxID=2740515 RepID=UPI001915AFD9|nr:DUF1501 domain-containing protein [Hydrogenimonas urashimensis]
MGTNTKRRDFLKQALATSAGIPALMSLLGAFERLEAADDGRDYKAIVCVLLEGGADVCNMIAPLDEKYDAYKAVRKNIALAKESLLSLTGEYGMRENMGDMQKLFQDGKLAVIANVGTLVEPVTAQEVEEGSKAIPFELFAHNTQRNQWMLGDATGGSRSGWAARAADWLYDPGDTAAAYANINAADVNTLLQNGGRHEAVQFADAEIPGDTMRSYGFGPESGGSDLGNVYQDIYESKMAARHKLMKVFASRRVVELNRPETLNGLFDGVKELEFDTGVHEVGKPLGKQLEIAAKILSVKENFPGTPKRQIFFVNHHGWDTHDSDNEHQAGYLSQSLGEFQNALDEMGLSEQVTTFTVSDFGRSLSPNGAGTDHGWGSHAFVMGGAVKGGAIYGTMPRIEPDSPDAWHDRLVPTIAMESYLATLAAWMGVSESDLDAIFPNLGSFHQRNLGFFS